MKYIFSLFMVLSLAACDEKPNADQKKENILLQKQEEIEGKALKNANQLLQNSQQHMQEIDQQ